MGRQNHCPNCEYQLPKDASYCPNCGQKQIKRLIPTRELVREFVESYFSFDSKLFRSIHPLLFKPGYLTRAYMQGKREQYISPLRLYLFTSVFFFFLVSLEVGNPQLIDSNDGVTSSEPDSLRKEESAPSDTTGVSQSNVVDSTQSEDDALFSFTYNTQNTAAEDDYEELDSSAINITGTTLQRAIERDDPNALLDSLEIERNFFTLMLARQGMRMYQQGGRGLAGFFINNMSIMMFFLLPVFALLLKLFYIRRKMRKRLYIEHLVFALHVHTFSFMMFTLYVIITYFLTDDFLDLLVLIPFIYLGIAMYNVYRQKVYKVILKYFLLLGSYLLVFSLALMTTAFVTFLLF